MKSMDLKECREQIDRIDAQIIELLEQRFDVVSDVAAYKKQRGMPILDEKREQEKLAALQELCSEEKSIYIAEILREMMAESRRYQRGKIMEMVPLEVQSEDAGTADAADKPLAGEMTDTAPELCYGLLGRGLGHSHSPQIHQMLGGYAYGLFDRESAELDAFFRDPAWRGISVTMPYKRDVMRYCDVISPQAKACNSVNTIVRRPEADGCSNWITYGHNTDYDGFKYVVVRSGIAVRGRKTLVLGSGGVSGTVVQVMRDLGADPVIIISRSGEDNYGNLERHNDAQIIVNATPVGMYPKGGEAVLDVTAFPGLKAVYDLIYNPLRTQLMLDAENAGIPAFGGLPMLVAQAAKAVELFGYPLNRSIEEACRIMEHELENIVLIGMPGVGKTTVGKALAKQTGRPFLDMDDEIRNRTGRTPEEIIREDGENRFRQIETEVLREITAAGGQIIAAGGGIVEREENRDLIRQNGKMIWLRRPLADLPLQGRPISQSDGLEAIFERREPRYRSWNDYEIRIQNIADAVESILAHVQEEDGR